MSIFEFVDYKLFLNSWIRNRPRAGRGEYRRLALHLNVSTTMVSQVFKGEKHLNLEMATELAEFLGLTDTELNYLYLLVEYARAGTKKLEAKLLTRIKAAQEVSRKVSERVVKDKELTSEEKSIYYSSWLYTGIRNLIATQPFSSVDSIAARLQLPRQQVQLVIDFLIANGLITINNGDYEYLVKRTHIAADHPLVHQHHKNWRIKGMEKMFLGKNSDLFYTGPMSLSAESAEVIRNEILNLLKRISEIVGDSKSEVVQCINIDWFNF